MTIYTITVKLRDVSEEEFNFTYDDIRTAVYGLIDDKQVQIETREDEARMETKRRPIKPRIKTERKS